MAFDKNFECERIGAVALIAYIPCCFIAAITSSPISAENASNPDSLALRNLLTLGLPYLFALFAVAFFLIRESDSDALRYFNAKNPLSSVPQAFFIGGLFSLSVLLVDLLYTYHFGENASSNSTAEFSGTIRSHSLIGLIFSFPLICIAIPIVEEFIFRGLFFSFLHRKFGFLTGIIITSITFGSLHPSHIVSAFILSALCCIIFHKHKSLTPPIIVHSTANASVFFLKLLAS